MNKIRDAITHGAGLRDDFVYYSEFSDYKSFPDPFPRTTFTVKECQETIFRYPNPDKPGELFRWDVHGRLLMPDQISLQGIALVMIHGGAANEYEFLFTPDGPERYLDLTKVSATETRVGVAQHVASLGVPVLVISSPGHYSRRSWPPGLSRKPEFVIGEIPSDAELKNRLSVYTFRMCLEAIKHLIETTLPNCKIYMWGHSTGGEYPYLMAKYGLRNELLGIIGFGSGMPANFLKEIDLEVNPRSRSERIAKLSTINGMHYRTPGDYVRMGYVGPNQPWKSAERWFELKTTVARNSSL